MSTRPPPAASEPAAPGDAREGEVLAGRYRLERVIGRGGMGVVYRAVQLNVERPVAVKLLRSDRFGEPASNARFLREARAISELSSPHAVTFIDVGETERGERFLVMELLTGEPLSARLAREAGLPVEVAARVLDHVACALSEAHARGVVHRDVKPANIYLVATAGYREFAKLVDFGVAAVDGDAEVDITTSSGVPGTPTHLAPERFSGEPARPQADVYALGVVAYQLLNGRAPFTGSSPWQLMQQHVTADPPPWEVSDCLGAPIPAPLRAFIMRCLSKAPELRPADGTAFREGLRAALRASGVAAPSTDAGTRTPAPPHVAGEVPPTLDAAGPGPLPRRLRRGVIVAVAAASLAAAAVVALLAGGVSSAPAADATGPGVAAVGAPPRPASRQVAPGSSRPEPAPERSVVEPAGGAADEVGGPQAAAASDGPAAPATASDGAGAVPDMGDGPTPTATAGAVIRLERPRRVSEAPRITVARPARPTRVAPAQAGGPRTSVSATAAATGPAPSAAQPESALTPEQARKVKALLD